MSIARPIPGYKGLIETCRARADELGISRLEIDRIAGLPNGYSAKLLGKQGGVKKPKRMWPIGLEAMLGTLGLKVILLEDEAATARTLALRVPVDRANQRFGNKCNSPLRIESGVSAKPAAVAAAPATSPPVSRAHLRVVQCKRTKYA
jgi:hypothetical protein